MTHYHRPFHQKQPVLLNCLILNQGPVVLSIVTSTSSLVVKILTVLVSLISNSQVFLLKNVELLQMQKLLTFFLMMWLKKAPSRSKWVKSMVLVKGPPIQLLLYCLHKLLPWQQTKKKSKTSRKVEILPSCCSNNNNSCCHTFKWGFHCRYSNSVGGISWSGGFSS